MANGIYNSANAGYIDAMFQSYKQDPSSVHPSWNAYFSTGEFVAPPQVTGGGLQTASAIGGTSSGPASSSTGGVDKATAKAYKLLDSFRKHGHLAANLDPLGIKPTRGAPSYRKKLTPEGQDLTADMDKVVNLSVFGETGDFAQPTTVKDLVAKAQQVYSGSIGVEFEHVSSEEARDFLYQEFEAASKQTFNKSQKVSMAKQLHKAAALEAFLKQKYNVKRFGLEGGESTIVALSQLLDSSAEHGVEEAVMGMAHRGRLNILTNIVGKPLKVLLSEFQGNYDAREAQQIDENGEFVTNFEHYPHAGDVKYHQGWSADNTTTTGKKMKVSMLPNPSHLETVNPLVVGYNRAVQDKAGDSNSEKSMPILLHGDAAFAGQGVVFETMAMHTLTDYKVGGTVHIVINNQVGFTTDPEQSRSGTYSSDVAKAFNAPVLHVNGDDVEAVARVSQIAANFRSKFKQDVVIDLICYRVNGHNEMDQPLFTQPTMYSVIGKQHDVYNKYKAKLGGEVSADEFAQIELEVAENLKQTFEDAKSFTDKPHESQTKLGDWGEMADPMTAVKLVKPTGVSKDELQALGRESVTLPPKFQLHKNIQRAYDDRSKSIETGTGMDWGTAETLAFASILNDGIDVRIAGQDAQRGTFSHRHATVHDQPTNDQHTPLQNLKSKKAGKFQVVNSLLSEYAALGFEYGHSLQSPKQLNIWEAQFGDFVNGGQIVIDNYINSGEYKWGRQSGLVMLLPHGYEGQGAEHSSARMERFLQSCNDDQNFVPKTQEQKDAYIRRNNWQVMNLTTGANYFHALRRQVNRNVRKPLVIMSPKSLLRNPAAASTYEDLGENSQFQPVLADSTVSEPSKVKRHIMVSGKVYYELQAEMEKRNVDKSKFAITRVEQVAPFPFDEVQEQVNKYPGAEVVWAQEEHQNMGAYSYVAPRINALLQNKGYRILVAHQVLLLQLVLLKSMHKKLKLSSPPSLSSKFNIVIAACVCVCFFFCFCFFFFPRCSSLWERKF